MIKNFDKKNIDETIRSINKMYENIHQFDEDENFDRLFIPKVSDYMKGLKMQCINEEELKEVHEYENENDDWLKSLTKKEKKIINKQKKIKMMKK